MFSASLSLAAKDTPRTGKKYQGVFAVSRRGGDEKTDVILSVLFFRKTIRDFDGQLHSLHQISLSLHLGSPYEPPMW